MPGGTYFRTYATSGGMATGTFDAATVSGFRLDKYLVTVGRFRSFVAAWKGGAGYTPPAGAGKHVHVNGGNGLAAAPDASNEPGWLVADNSQIAPTDANLACGAPFDTWTSAPGSQENLPINCVNWYEAYAFCIWDGGFLPSEAEWKLAASGGGGASGQRQYPWGMIAPGTGNQYAIYGCNHGGAGTCTSVANVAPVGSATLGAGLWGQLDLVGNVWEWGVDWYADTYVDPCNDCANFTPTSLRVGNGGDFYGAEPDLLSSNRGYGPPMSRGYGVGLRCARAP